MTSFKDIQDLYQTDPENFEQRAQDLIGAWIDTRPKEVRERLRAMNWSLNQQLDHITDPTEKMNKLIEMVGQQTKKLDDVLAGKHLPDETPLTNIVKLSPKDVDPDPKV